MERRDKFIFIFLIGAFLAVLLIAFFLGFKLLQFEPVVYYFVPPEKTFIYSAEELKYGLEKYLREAVETEMSKLIDAKENFIYADLKNMELTLYKKGEKFKVFPIQSKGEEWFWGKTPPGVYSAGFKARLHFSSVARVWMPYAVQYYGNYFIHGWPYDRAGRPLLPGPSGGCIRLKAEDAAILFEFVKEGMPILIFDEKIQPPLPALLSTDKRIAPPKIKAQAFLVADLDTGEILLSKEVDSEISAGPAVKGMLALTASDNINLEKRIIARTWMFEGVNEKIIVPGKSYQGYELLFPLLSQSSNEAALVLSRFLDPEEFLRRMNAKAKGIGMKKTNFQDITGLSKENITILYDVAKMMRYIKDYRSFIFDISEEWIGQEDDQKETIFKILRIKSLKEDQISNDKEKRENLSRFIFIGIANSPDAKADLENITLWLNNNLARPGKNNFH